MGGEVSDPIFRQMFVELGQAAMDALRVMANPVPVSAHRLIRPAAVRVGSVSWLKRSEVTLMRRFGWSHVEVCAVEYDRTTRIYAGLECGHVTRYSVTDMEMMRVAPACFQAVLDVIDRTPRGCFCVQRDPP